MFQAAYDLHAQGWEVTKAAFGNVSAEVATDGLGTVLNRTVAVVDDAHLLSPGARHKLGASASDRVKVIIGYTSENPGDREAIEIAPSQAVAYIANDLRKRRAETLLAVRNIDSTVGDDYLQTRLEDRISDASDADRPWQFNFILTGGWLRARQQLAVLRDHDDADLLLGAVAINQICSLDADSSPDFLQQAGRTLLRNDTWVETTSELLQQRRLLIPGRQGFRCPHLRYANVVLRAIFVDRRSRRVEMLASLVQTVLSQSPPLRGVSWLLNELRLTDAFRGTRQDKLITPDIFRAIAERCWKSEAGEARRDAAFALDALLVWGDDAIESIRTNIPRLRGWLEALDEGSAYGLGTLLNSVSQQTGGSELLQEIFVEIDHKRVAKCCTTSTSIGAHSLGYFIGRVASVAPKHWKRKIARVLDETALYPVLHKITLQSLSAVDELISGVYFLDCDKGWRLLARCMPQLQQICNSNPAEAWSRLDSIGMFVLGGTPFPTEKWPTHRERVMARKFVAGIDPTAISKAIQTGTARDWENLARFLHVIRDASPGKAAAVGLALDTEMTDMLHPQLWSKPADPLLRIIWLIRPSRARVAPQSWFEKHEREITVLSPRLALLSPAVSARCIERGLSLSFGLEAIDWGTQAYVILMLSRVSVRAARKVMMDNGDRLATSLSNLKDFEIESLGTFVEVAEKVARDQWCAILRSIDLSTARATWHERCTTFSPLRRASRSSRASLLKLGFSAIRCGGVTRDLGREIVQCLRPRRDTSRKSLDEIERIGI